MASLPGKAQYGEIFRVGLFIAMGSNSRPNRTVIFTFEGNGRQPLQSVFLPGNGERRNSRTPISHRQFKFFDAAVQPFLTLVFVNPKKFRIRNRAFSYQGPKNDQNRHLLFCC